MTDERHGLPSASEAHRIHACPGMLNLKRSLPPRPETSSPDAESGTRIAAALAGTLDLSLLTDEESKVFDRLVDGRAKIQQAVFSDFTLSISRESEKRIWLQDDDGNNIFSGRFDAAYYLGDTALVVDDKSGRNEVAKAAGNMQLRALAVLVQANIGAVMFKRIVVAINQPWFSPAYSLAEYDEIDLSTAHKELLDALAAAKKPDAPRKAGSHCAYCACITDCLEAREYALTPPLRELPTGMTPATIAATLTAETLATFLERRVMAKKIIEAVEDEAKRRLTEDPDSIPGWTLKPNAPLTPIQDSETVFARAEKLGVTYPAFKECIDIGKDKLEKAVKAATGQKGKQLEATMEALVHGCTGETPKAPSLARTKP